MISRWTVAREYHHLSSHTLQVKSRLDCKRGIARRDSLVPRLCYGILAHAFCDWSGSHFGSRYPRASCRSARVATSCRAAKVGVREGSDTWGTPASGFRPSAMSHQDARTRTSIEYGALAWRQSLICRVEIRRTRRWTGERSGSRHHQGAFTQYVL